MAVEPFAGLEKSIAKSLNRVTSTWNITKSTSKPLSYARPRTGGLSKNIIVLLGPRASLLSSPEGQ